MLSRCAPFCLLAVPTLPAAATPHALAALVTDGEGSWLTNGDFLSEADVLLRAPSCPAGPGGCEGGGEQECGRRRAG